MRPSGSPSASRSTVGHLRAVAYRMLGSLAEADDAVQDAWLRASRAGADEVENLRRLADDDRRPRLPQHAPLAESPPRGPLRGPSARPHHHPGGRRCEPEEEALLADSVRLALLVVLDTLTPAERLAFVLHDMFELPFDDIAPIVGRSPEAARQLASRARRRVRGAALPRARPGHRPPARGRRRVLRARRAPATSMPSSPSSTPTSSSAPTSAPGAGPSVLRGAAAVARPGARLSSAAPGAQVRPALVNGAPGGVIARARPAVRDPRRSRSRRRPHRRDRGDRRRRAGRTGRRRVLGTRP